MRKSFWVWILCACGQRQPAAAPPLSETSTQSQSMARPQADRFELVVADGPIVGPFWSFGESTGALVYARQWKERYSVRVRPLLPDGAPAGPEQEIPSQEGELSHLSALSTKGGGIVAWASKGRDNRVYVASFDRRGILAAQPKEWMTQGTTRWIEAVPCGENSIVSWAEAKDERADLRGVFVGSYGDIQPTPSMFVSGALSWQVRKTIAGAWLAWIRVRNGTQDAAAYVQKIGADGELAGLPLLVSGKMGADRDIDLSDEDGRGPVVAWTTTVGDHSQVAWNRVDGGVPQIPRLVTTNGHFGPLRAMTQSKTPVILWGDPAVHLARIGEKQPLIVTMAEKAETWEISGSSDGTTVLAGSGHCATGCATTTLLHFDEDLREAGHNTLPAGTTVWGLRRIGSEARVLSFLKDRVSSQRVRIDKPHGPVVTAKPETRSIAQLKRRETIQAEGVAAFVPTKLGSNLAVFRMNAGCAVCTLSVVGVSKTPPVDRAVPASGFSFAPNKTGGVLGWVGIDQGDPEVHLTVLDAAGRRVDEIQATIHKGQAGNIELAPLDEGTLLVWVDERSGHPRVYATRYDAALHRMTREEPISPLGKDVAHLRIANWQREYVLATWIARGEQTTEVCISAISKKNAQPSPPTWCVEREQASRPHLSVSKDSVRQWWVERDENLLVTETRQGGEGTDPTRVGGTSRGRLLAYAIDDTDSSRVVVLRETRDELILEATSLTGPNPGTSVLWSRRGKAGADAKIAFYQGALYLADSGLEKLEITWLP